MQRCTVHKHRNLLAHAPERLHEEISADYTDMIYAASPEEIETRRKAFIRKWRLKCRAVADSLEEAGERLLAFTRLPPSQWKSARTTDEIDKRYFVTSPNTSASMFFGSTASLVFFRPDRPISQPPRAGAVKAWALIDPSTAACSHGSGGKVHRGLAQLEIRDAVSYCRRARATSWRSVVHRLKAPPGRLIRALPD